MNEATIKMIQDLATELGTTSEHIISTYAQWYKLSSLCWIFIGSFFMISAWKVPNPDSCDKSVIPFVRSVAFISGLMMLGANIPNLFYPEVLSINSLLTSIGGQ